MNSKQITDGYWAPERGSNPSADREAGNRVVDALTLSELVEFFNENHAGPTYCLVKERLKAQLEKLPPRLDIAAAHAQAAIALRTLKLAISKLNSEINGN